MAKNKAKKKFKKITEKTAWGVQVLYTTEDDKIIKQRAAELKQTEKYYKDALKKREKQLDEIIKLLKQIAKKVRT